MANQCLGAFPAGMLDDLEEYRRSVLLRKRAIHDWFVRLCEMNALIEQLVEAPRGSVGLHGNATSAHAAIAASLEPSGQRRRIVLSSGDFHSMRYLWRQQRLVDSRSSRSTRTARRMPRPRPSSLPRRDRADRRRSPWCRRGRARCSTCEGSSSARMRSEPSSCWTSIKPWVSCRSRYPTSARTSSSAAPTSGSAEEEMGLAFAYVEPSKAVASRPLPGMAGARRHRRLRRPLRAGRGRVRFQQGALAMGPIYTARAGIQWVLDQGIDAIRKRSLELTQRLCDRATGEGARRSIPAGGEQAWRYGLHRRGGPGSNRRGAEREGYGHRREASRGAAHRTPPVRDGGGLRSDTIDAIAAQIG